MNKSFDPRLPLLKAAALCAALLVHGGAAAASLGLAQAYQAALQNDPVYRGAVQDNQAGKEYRTLGRAALLPTVSANISKSKNRADLTQPVAGQDFTTHPEYFSGVKSISLRQPVLNLDGLARYKQGIAQSNYSAAQFDVRTQELVLRVVGAYIEALFASEQVRLTLVARDTYEEQMKVNQRLFQRGEGTRTDMLETQAKLDLAEAQVLEAKDNEATARTTLAGIVGQEVDSLDELAPNFRIAPLNSGGFEEWKALALANNPQLLSHTYAIEAARQEVNKARAGHAPRLDIVASYSKNESETINTYTQDSTVRSVGFQLNIPLYSGGSVNATSRQAVAGYEKAKSELQVDTDKNMTELRKQYSTVVSSVARIQALDKAVASGKLLMVATEQSIKGGVRINLDLLNARQQLFTSQRDLAQARYNYLMSILRLRAAAGTLVPDDVREIARYFR